MTDELSRMIGELDRRCKAAGPETPAGSRLSMLGQQLQIYQKAESADQKHALATFMARVQAELQQIERDGGEYIPENHRPGTGQ